MEVFTYIVEIILLYYYYILYIIILREDPCHLFSLKIMNDKECKAL